MIGGVRIAQLRSQRRSCLVHHKVHSSGHGFRCYGGDKGDWTADTESKEPFGSFAPYNQTLRGSVNFTYDGVYGKTGEGVGLRSGIEGQHEGVVGQALNPKP